MKEALSLFPFVELIGAALILFLLLFVALLIWTFRRGSKEIYDNAQQLPMDGENYVEQ